MANGKPTLRDVAAEAGVSHGLVQHHFGTREQLIAAIMSAPLPGAEEGARKVKEDWGDVDEEAW